MTTLGNRIKKRRTELNMTQEELAYKLGYKSKSSINKVENGENDLPQAKIKDFSEALKTTPAYLMGWEDLKNAEWDEYSDLLFDMMNHLESEDDLIDFKNKIKNSEILNEDYKKSLLSQAQDIYSRHNNKYGDHNKNLEYFSDKPELLELYKNIHESESLQLLFDSARDLEPEDLETVLIHIQGIRKARGLD